MKILKCNAKQDRHATTARVRYKIFHQPNRKIVISPCTASVLFRLSLRFPLHISSPSPRKNIAQMLSTIRSDLLPFLIYKNIEIPSLCLYPLVRYLFCTISQFLLPSPSCYLIVLLVPARRRLPRCTAIDGRLHGGV